MKEIASKKEIDKKKKIQNTKYFLEYRFTKKQYVNQWNSPKAKLEDLFFYLHEKLSLERISERKRFIPHSTFIPPFKNKNINDVIKSLNNHFEVKKLNPEEIYFSFKKTTIFPHEGKEYLVVLLEPSEKLFDLQKILKNNTLHHKDSSYDFNMIRDWNPHIEIGDNTQIKDITKAKQIADNYLLENKIIGLKEPISRICVIEKYKRKSKIYAEYDFIQKKWFNRYESLNNEIWKITAKEINSIYNKLNNLK